MPMPFDNAAMPDWVPPAAMGVVPGYDELLARARTRMLGVTDPAAAPAAPGPSNISDTTNDILSSLSPEARQVIDRLPPNVRNELVQRFSRNSDNRPVRYSPNGEAPSGSLGFGDQTFGPGYRFGSMAAMMVNPVLGLGMEATRRANNVSRVNTLRDMLGIDEKPGWFSDFFGGVGKGNRDTVIGSIDRGVTTTPVSLGGVASFTPQEAYNRQRSYASYTAPAQERNGGGRSAERSERDLDRESRGATGERTSQRGGMGGL